MPLIPIVQNLSNSAPIATILNSGLASIKEGTNSNSVFGDTVRSLFAKNFSDQDHLFAGVALVDNLAVYTQGSWQYRSASGSLWQIIPSVSDVNPFILLADDLVRFLPNGNFSGSPGTLSVRLLESSQQWQRGVLSNGEALSIGGFGSVSSAVVQLSTLVIPIPKSPTSLILNLLEPGVPTESNKSFAQLVGSDPDTASNILTYKLLEAKGASGVDRSAFFTLSSSGALSRNSEALPVSEKSISFKFSVDDGITKPLDRLFSVGVLNDTNRAPSVVSGKSLILLPSINEGSSNPPGQQVLGLFNSSFTDFSSSNQIANGLDFAGIAVVNNTATALQGAWQYRLVSGSSWIPLPLLSESKPFISGTSTELRFLPRSSFNGDPGHLVIRLIDGSKSIQNGSYNGVLELGGSSNVSYDTINLSTSILQLPKPPSSLTLDLTSKLSTGNVSGDSIGRLYAIDPDSSTNQVGIRLDGTQGDNSLVSLDNNGLIKLSDNSNQSNLATVRGRGFMQIFAEAFDEGLRVLKSSFRIPVQNDINRSPIALAQTTVPPVWAPQDNVSSDILKYRLYLDSINQGTSLNSITGGKISDLFGNQSVFQDNISSNNTNVSFAGIAITANEAALNPLNGRWQYSVNNGISWITLQTVSESVPLILQSEALLRYAPSSFFSGVPGALSVRLLDNSIPIINGLLLNPETQPLISGGSGAASADILQLLTYIEPSLSTKAPEKVFFQTSRSIPSDGGIVAADALLGTFASLDFDTPSGELIYKLIPNSILLSTLSNSVYVLGNQLRTKSSVSVDELKLFKFKLAVSDRRNQAGEPVFVEFNNEFILNQTSFDTPLDLTVRSDTSVIPFITSSDGTIQAILFSATGISRDINVAFGPVMTADDFSSFDSSSIGLTSSNSQASKVTITPLSPLLDFSINLDNPGEVVRFEFELPSLKFNELLEINYMKLNSLGIFSIFSYQTDDFGVSTGARLEQKINDVFISLDKALSNDIDVITTPVYLAVYVQDNGRGDDDSRLGVIRDPGAPMSIRIAAQQPVQPTVSVSIDPVTSDNIINIQEGSQASLTLTGTTIGAKQGDLVTLKLNGKTFSANLTNDGKFSINVSGADLLADSDRRFDVNLSTTSSTGNTTTTSSQHSYSIDTGLPTVSIFIDPVTSDNIVNIQEGSQALLALTGTTIGAKQGDLVTLNLNGKTFSANLAIDGKFSINVTGADLLADSDRRFDVNLSTTSSTGNTTTASIVHSYSIQKGLAFNSNPENMLIQMLDSNNNGSSEFEFVVNREAYYDNVVNFYKVDDSTTGQITVNGISSKPSDTNYIALATTAGNVLSTVSNVLPSLAVANLTEVSRNLDFKSQTGFWMPYVHVSNTGETYFPYSSANKDKTDHFAHTRGADGFDYLLVEDLPYGGDNDFDDIIIRINRLS